MTDTLPDDQMYAIAEQVFSAMVDGDVGLLQRWVGDVPAIADPLVAWVDLHGDWTGRAALTTSLPVAHDLTRALIKLDAHEEVVAEDLVDAFGELANVVGGNLKALMPTHGTLGLPQVASVVPDVAGMVSVEELHLSWRGHLIVVSIWMLG
jgi:chemotaxis protein CheX